MPEQKEKGPLELVLQTNREEIIPIQSIPHFSGHIPFSFEEGSTTEEPIWLDSFVGKVRDFKLHLQAQRVLLKASLIAP